MKKRLLFPLVVLGLAVTVRADLALVQEIEDFTGGANGAKEQVSLYLSGPRLRLDKGQSMTSIVLDDRKITYSIMHETRQYVQMPHNLFKGLAGATGAVTGAAAQAPDALKVEATDKQETISGYPCRLVKVRDPNGALTEIWVTRNAAELDTFLGELKRVMDFGMPTAGGVLDKHPELRGIPMRVTEYEGASVVRRSTVKSLDRSKLPSSVFEVPSGYEEIKMPSLPVPGRTGGAAVP